ncbi:MAG TPA: GNAT family N-acetyltransferase [Arachnia sp.]|nr:GNAT family N-acetyltransferase [Arachnia sp.]
MTPFLETRRLVLRRFTPGDLDALVALDGDPAVMRFITGGVPTSRAEIEDDHLPAFLAYYDRGDRWGFWAAEEKSTGRFLGWFHLRPHAGEPEDEPELGYRLISEVWGEGYATEGSEALIRKAFTELGARRVYAQTMAVHTASRRVMEKAGLRFVRTFVADWPVRIEGDEHGDVEYALTLQEWQARPSTVTDPRTRPLRILFHAPQIPNNTGATMRLAAVTGAELHLARPLGFDMDDAKLRRAGLDYRDEAATFVHDSLAAAYGALLPARLFAFTAHAEKAYTDVAYAPGDVLLFGPEPTGLAADVLTDPRITERVRIPMRPGMRSLNLANAAAIAVYEAWRQLGHHGAA